MSAVRIIHTKVNTITDWVQADLDAEIALGNFPGGTVLADIVLPSDWNQDHEVVGLNGLIHMLSIGAVF